MYCRKCGKEILGTAEFCEDCNSKPVAMRICPYCGKETSKEERFCQYCDGFFKDAPNMAKKTQASSTVKSVNSNAMKTCRACGQLIPKSSFYCPKCRKMADTTPAPISSNTNQGETGNKGSFAIGFLLVWFVGLIGLIIAYYMKQSETWRGAKFCFKLALIILVVVLVICGIVVWAAMKDSGYYY